MTHKGPRKSIWQWLNAHSSQVAYVLMAAVVALAFWLNGINQEADQKARCEAGVDTRNVDRAQAQAFYLFVLESLPSKEESAKLPFNEQQKVRDYQVRLNNYRSSLYKLIHPSELCAKYVTDDNVEPPTSPEIIIPKKNGTNS